MNKFFRTHTHDTRKFPFKKKSFFGNKILHTILKLILNIRLFIHVFYTSDDIIILQHIVSFDTPLHYPTR